MKKRSHKYRVFLQKKSEKNSRRKRRKVDARSQPKTAKEKSRKRKLGYESRSFNSGITYRHQGKHTLIAPRNFTLSEENAPVVISYINRIKNAGLQDKQIVINLSQVRQLGEGAIAMLSSVIHELKSKEKSIEGIKPSNVGAREILEKSGFFKYLKAAISVENQSTKNALLKTGDNKTPHSEISEEIRKAMETVWNSRARCPQLFGGIVEMIRNSCDHAFAASNEVQWHLGMTHLEAERKVKFSFVDNGKGIVKTFKSGTLKAVLTFFTNDGDIIRTAFENGIESRTGLKWRGKGLPYIFELSQDKIISRLVIITNQVYLDFDNDIQLTLPNNFQGTYYYWEVNLDCTPAYFL